MKIRKLQLKNIGVFDDETIEFQPCPTKDKAEIHIFTGQNGSGKTTILMALSSVFGSGFAETDNESSFSTPFYKRMRHYDEGKKFTGFGDITNILNDFPDLIKCTFDNNKENIIKVYKDKEKRIFASQSSTKDYEAVLRGNVGKINFAVFAFSGYRNAKSERIEAIKEPKDFNPLFQSLEFVKNYTQEDQLTINQLIANNISKSAIEKGRNKEKSKKFANVIKSIEQAITEITSWKVEFDIETEPTNLITKVNGKELDFDVLPDGLQSLISWIADLFGRVDLLKWEDDLPIFEKNLILLLDEIEVHLHPEWQRKVLPVVQKLFKNSQIFVSTHSPFVVNSIDDAWVYELEVKDGKAKVREKNLTKTTDSIQTTLEEVFEVPQIFGYAVQKDLDRFYELRSKVKNNGGKADKEFKEIAKRLLKKSEEQNSVELQSIVAFELKQLKYEL